LEEEEEEEEEEDDDDDDDDECLLEMETFLNSLCVPKGRLHLLKSACLLMLLEKSFTIASRHF
jgi:hypothetical protein